MTNPCALESSTCPGCAYLEGAAVAFGIIAMAQAINAFVKRVGTAMRGCPDCLGGTSRFACVTCDDKGWVMR